MAESFNATLKRLQRWKEVPIDSIVLALYNLQCYHFNEIQRGFSGKQVKSLKHLHSIFLYVGLGNYELLPSLSYLKRPVKGMKSITCVSPDDMAEFLSLTSII